MPENGRWDLIRRLKINQFSRLRIWVTNISFRFVWWIRGETKMIHSSFIIKSDTLIIGVNCQHQMEQIIFRFYRFCSCLVLYCVFVLISSFQYSIIFFFLWCCSTLQGLASSNLRFLDHTQRRITVGRTPLGERSARRRDLYLITNNTRSRKTSMPPRKFEPTISAGERL